MKYLSEIFICGKRYDILAKDVFCLQGQPELLVKRVVYDKTLTEEEMINVYEKIRETIYANEEEIQTIESVISAVIKNITVELRNVNLAKYTQGLATIFINAINENGLLNIDWSRLKFWDFLILSKLQELAIKEHNKKIKGVLKK